MFLGKKTIAICLSLAAGISAARDLAAFTGELTAQTSGWCLHSDTSVTKFESAPIPLEKPAGTAACYEVSFEASATERAYAGIDFYDAEGKPLPDCYDVLYAGGRRTYRRIFYAMPRADKIRLFFRAQAGAKYRVWNLAVKSTTGEAAAAYADRVYAEDGGAIPFAPPADAMALLPKTAAALKSGAPYHVVFLGDSIMQDAFHSLLPALLKREFPKSNFRFTLSMRGGTGCWLYADADAFKTYVYDLKPDLLVIGGISGTCYRTRQSDSGSTTELATAERIGVVVRAAKAFCSCEVLLLTPALSVDTRMIDPAAPEASLPVQPWNAGQSDFYRRSYDLAGAEKLAQEERIPLWDVMTPTYRWLYASGKPYQWYSRDSVHSGERGKQIIGRTLLEYFKTAK